MATLGGPNIATSGLVFAMDTASPGSISGLGCTGFNNAPQLIKNLVSRSQSITSHNGVRLANMNFYTAFAIDYPESSFGGDAASRQGITPGYDVRSGGKTYDASRALHLWVWNEDTQAWVPDSYFTGWALSGHCYDSYVGTAEVDKWVADYNKIKLAFPNCTYIVAGSHRDSYHTAAQYAILKDLGAPSNVDSIINFSSPEWILVGRPGLGAGNAYGWAFQNYSTNPDYVAHLNFGLPAFGNNDSLNFDGTNDYVEISSFNFDSTNEFTLEAFVKFNSVSGSQSIIKKNTSNDGWPIFQMNTSGANLQGYYSSPVYGQCLEGAYTTNNPLTTGVWYHIAFSKGTAGYTSMKLHINGVSVGYTNYLYGSHINSIANSSKPVHIGRNFDDGTWVSPLNGNLANVKCYNRQLTDAEIAQNFNAQRSRFGI